MKPTTQESTLDALLAEAWDARKRAQELHYRTMVNGWKADALIERAQQNLRLIGGVD